MYIHALVAVTLEDVSVSFMSGRLYLLGKTVVHWLGRTTEPSVRFGTVKLSLHRLDRPAKVQESEAYRIFRQWHMKVARLSALCSGYLYPKGISLVVISVRG